MASVGNKSHQVLSEETSKAWADPGKLAATILHSVNDQSTEAMEQIGSENDLFKGQSLPKGPTVITPEEVQTATSKQGTRPERLPHTLPVDKVGLESISGIPEPATPEGSESGEVGDSDHPMSEASEVKSLTVLVRELDNTTRAFQADIAKSMMGIETRLSKLEAWHARQKSPPPHQRIISGSSIVPLTLGGHTTPQALPVKVNPDQVSGLRYSPSKNVQRQLLKKAAPGNEIEEARLPLAKSDWIPSKLASLFR